MYLSYAIVVLASIANLVLSSPELKIKTASSNKRYTELLSENRQKECQEWTRKRHKVVSFTYGGEMCIDNCDKTCMTGWDGKRKPCEVGSKRAPVYFTSRSQEKSQCLTKCGKFGWSYDWCIVADGFYWDYCSSETNYKKEKTHFTTDGDRCAKPCQLDASNKHTCVTVWGARKDCDVEKTVDFVHAKTIYGVPCAGPCERASETSPYKCYDMNRNNEMCAPPAQMRPNISCRLWYNIN